MTDGEHNKHETIHHVASVLKSSLRNYDSTIQWSFSKGSSVMQVHRARRIEPGTNVVHGTKQALEIEYWWSVMNDSVYHLVPILLILVKQKVSKRWHANERQNRSGFERHNSSIFSLFPKFGSELRFLSFRKRILHGSCSPSLDEDRFSNESACWKSYRFVALKLLCRKPRESVRVAYCEEP